MRPHLLLLSSIVGAGMTACASIALVTPAAAQNTVQIGVLNCNVAGGAGFVFGSTKNLSCTFNSSSGGREGYYGTISKFGIDIGATQKSVISWAVLAPSKDVPRGAIAGNYGGVSGEATFGVGLGANVLVGGLKNSIALQPLSVQAQQGLNIAAGIASLTLRSAN